MAYVMAPPDDASAKRNLRPPPAAGGFPPCKKDKWSSLIQKDQKFINNVSFCIPATNFHADKVRDKCASIFARLQQIDPTLTLLHIDESSNDPPLTSGPSFPIIPQQYYRYFSEPVLTCNFGTVHAFLQSSTCFNNIKYAPFFISFLQQHRFFLDLHTISSVNVSQVGWLYEIHPEQHSPTSIQELLRPLIDPDILDKIQFKINLISHCLDRKVHTRTWVLQMDKAHIQIYNQTLFQTLNHEAPLTLGPITTGVDHTGVIKCAMINHNAFLRKYTTIRIDNVLNINTPLYDFEDNNIPSIISNLTTPDSKNQSIADEVTQYSKTKIQCLCPRDSKEHQTTELHNYFRNFLPQNIHSSLKDEIFIPNTLPTIISSNSIPSTIAIYNQSASQYNFKIPDEKDSKSNLSSPQNLTSNPTLKLQLLKLQRLNPLQDLQLHSVSPLHFLTQM